MRGKEKKSRVHLEITLSGQNTSTNCRRCGPISEYKLLIHQYFCERELKPDKCSWDGKKEPSGASESETEKP